MKNSQNLMDFSFLENNLLTVIVLGRGNKDLLDSFGEISYSLIELEKYKNNIKLDSIWKMFIYSDEMLSPELREALPIFLNLKLPFDFYSLFRRSKPRNGVITHSLSPRIFRSQIKLKSDSVYPEQIKGLRGEQILNGFVLEQN